LSAQGAAISQVVKVQTVDGHEKVLEPEFVELCSEVKKKVAGKLS
jgi:hypothetical protein